MVRNSKGITLIVLVITIIVLLILAGVSLNLIAGREGILNKAVIAAQKMEKESAKEQAEIVVADCVAEFYDKKYVQGESQESAGTYVKNALAKGKKEGNYFIKTEGSKIVVYQDEKLENQIVFGKVKESGKIDWINEEKMIHFSIKIETDSLGNKGTFFSFEAYEGEIWRDWFQRMWEKGDLNEINDAAGGLLERMFREEHDTGNIRVNYGEGGSYVNMELRTTSEECRYDDVIEESVEYLFDGYAY